VTAPAGTVTLAARPEAVAFDPASTAVIVVDMQNDFGADTGMFARAGIDIAPIRATVQPTARVLTGARAAGIKVIYLKMEFRPDLADAGSPASPNWLKHLIFHVGQEVTAPDGTASRVLVRDTWNTAILPELSPEPGDIVVSKHRFSGFYGTDLDVILKGLGTETLIFTGCTTSVCVESTLRDAMYRDYRCIVLADCVGEPIGAGLPRSNHDATLLVTEILFGWVSESSELLRALE
jgi:ureidoacrylate peracid hydrolase